MNSLSTATHNHRLGFVDYFAIFTIVFYALVNFSETTQIALWIFLPISVILIFFRTKTLFFNPYLKYLAWLYIWFLITAITAYNVEVAFISVKRTVAVFLFCYVLSYLSKKNRTSWWVAITYLIFFINCVYYAQTHILEVADINDSFRMTDEKLNANLFGYFLFFVTFFVYHLGIISNSQRAKTIFRLLFFCLIPLSFFIALLTASRQILLLQVPYFAILIYYRYWKTANFLVKFILIAITFIACAFLADHIIESYNTSNLATRSKVQVTDDPRADLAKEAFNIGLKNPIFGVGPDNFKLISRHHNFSHNSYVELFANSGLPAVIIYCLMLARFIKVQYRSWHHKHDAISFSFLIFGIFYAFDNIFYVFYLNPWLMGILVFVGDLSSNKHNKFSNI